MIDETVRQISTRFRKSLAERLEIFPNISIGLDWPSMSALDELCYHLRYRNNWSAEEVAFLNGVSAIVGELTYACWRTFHKEIQLRETPSGIECIANLSKGLFSSSRYILPITQSLRKILQEPQNPFPVLGKQFIIASDQTNFVGSYALGTCLGMSSYGQGEWAEKLPGDLSEHLEKAVPYLAETTEMYYNRLYGHNSHINHMLFESNLIWPPEAYHGDFCSNTAAEGIIDYEKNLNGHLNKETLLNLAKFPDRTISDGAIVLLLSRLSSESLNKEFTEICFNQISSSSSGYRQVAIDIANKEGRQIDWLVSKDKSRFLLEKRLNVLPILHLSFETCLRSENKDLVNSLVAVDLQKAIEQLKSRIDDGPEYLFQKGMLHKVQQQTEQVEEVFRAVEKKYPQFQSGEFFNERGMNALNLNQNRRAIDLLKTAVSAGDPFGRALSNLGWAYISVQEYEEAIKVLNRAVAQSDFVVTSLLNRAFAFKESGREDLARQDIEKAVSLYPYDRRCISNVMGSYY